MASGRDTRLKCGVSVESLVPRIPALPISYRDAQARCHDLLRRSRDAGGKFRLATSSADCGAIGRVVWPQGRWSFSTRPLSSPLSSSLDSGIGRIIKRSGKRSRPQPLLEALGGPEAPHGFVGGLPITYRLGPTAGKVTLDVKNEFAERRLYNVIARLPGRLPASEDNPVLVGNHRGELELRSSRGIRQAALGCLRGAS